MKNICSLCSCVCEKTVRRGGFGNIIPARCGSTFAERFYCIGCNFLCNKKTCGKSTGLTCARRFELPTFWSVARRSIQLSYAHMLEFSLKASISIMVLYKDVNSFFEKNKKILRTLQLPICRKKIFFRRGGKRKGNLYVRKKIRPHVCGNGSSFS